MENPTYSLKDLNFEFDLSEANYEMDVLQNKLLQTYLRADPKFRKAFSINFTPEFIQFLKDKARLHEPVHLSVMGLTRTFRENNFIFTEKGWRKPIDLKDCKKVLSWNFDLERYEWQKFELVERERDPKETFYRITFSDNRSIEIGENHPIFTTTKGWKRAFSLYPKIKIPFFSDYPKQKSKDKISFELTRIVASLLSCGHLNNSHSKYLNKKNNKYYRKVNHTINYASPYKEMINLFKSDFKKEFGLMMRNKIDKRNKKCYYIEKGSKEIFQFLSKFVPVGKKSFIMEIPPEIFNASKEIQAEFVATLFSGDGYVSGKTNIIEYYTMSKKFAQQLQMLLMQYGIISVIRKKKKNIQGNVLQRITITNKKNILNFAKFVGRLPNKLKNSRLKKICQNLKHLQKNLVTDNFCITKKEKLSYKKEKIYDIYVEKNNNFFLNGILTHNSSKSYISIGIQAIMMALNGKMVTADYICPNAMDFLEKLRTLPQENLTNSCFLIDEEKTAMFGYGSVAKKMKLQDVANIVAINNISTISLNPISWANKEAMYGLRTFGRCFKTKTSRLMLYNLQAGGRGGESPMGCLYLPIFTTLLPKPYAEKLEKDYLAKKNAWVMQEQRGEGDVLAEMRKRLAEEFVRDEQYMSLTKKNERLAYIQQKLGSEWTTSECNSVLLITQLLNQGIDLN